MDLGLAVRPQPIARIPQTAHDACRDAPRTSGALIGSIRCDALGLEAVDAALGIVPGHLVQSRIDHSRHARDRQRRFRDIRRHDDASSRRSTQSTILSIRVKRSMQRNHLDVRGRLPFDFRNGSPNLRSARKKTEDVSIGRREEIARAPGNGPSRLVRNVHVVEPPRHVDDRTAVEERSHRICVERRRHHDDAQIVACAPGLARQRQREVGMDAALVEFVDDDGAELRQERIGLQPRSQNAFGDDE